MNADPRRPEKVQRYTAKANNGNGQEDLTPDYMNILGQHQTTGNAVEASEKHVDSNAEPNLQPHTEAVPSNADEHAATTNATNVIPPSPQYGVAIISNAPASADQPAETTPTETLTDTTAKSEDKELHSTPSRNDRFKVVKIASLEPFKRGRWKCMDYVDEAPPAGAARVPQSTGSIQSTGGSYMHSQSLPQQQIQQMLLQGGFTNGTQFFTNMPQQMVPQGQYFYSQMANVPNQQMGNAPNSIPAQFIGNQAFFPAGVVQNSPGFLAQTFPNVQYVPNVMQNQSGTFLPISQAGQFTQNFQQSQSYAGQPNVAQSGVAQPMVNGHTYNPQNEQQVAGSLPAQSVKSMLLNTNNPPQVSSQTQIAPPNMQNHIPIQNNPAVNQTPQYQQNTFQQPVTVQQPQSQPAHNVAPTQVHQINPAVQVGQPQPQNLDQTLASNMYTNPKFAVSVNSLAVLDNSDNTTEVNETNSGAETVAEHHDDPAKTNPVVNAIDNKIEQAMDLVKSHLMYTVREEVEVLKEKIAELMERIQQLETENNFLRSQIPKAQSVSAAPPATILPQPAVITNPSPNFIPNSNTNPVASSAPVTNPNQNNAPITQGHSLPPTDAINQQ
ncbi:unnamed protein product [Phaedon cochleariae]|uniref:Protein Asterix n=1 Tax=Phaedon cochleariae TaxID=80249 RepID=A0A9N9SIK8_PHACE|nr:unnamed protein product [Phaedon cochleariae]